MKTLNEVIELSERCTLPYPGNCLNCEYFEDETGYDCRCKIIADALHYLKLLKTHCDRVQNQIENLREEHRPNDPLTWEELREMEGKPVWVEDNLDVPEDITKCWAVVKKFEKAECCEYVVLDNLCYGKREHGKVWQAYRKERE